MPIVLAHQSRGVALAPPFRDDILRIEREDVVIAAGLGVQKIAQAREMLEGLLQLGSRLVAGLMHFLDPADQLIVPKPAGSLFDVGLEMVEGAGVLGVALAREL